MMHMEKRSRPNLRMLCDVRNAVQRLDEARIQDRLLGRIVRLWSWSSWVALATRPGFRNPPSVQAVEPDQEIPDGAGVSFLLDQLRAGVVGVSVHRDAIQRPGGSVSGILLAFRKCLRYME